MNTSTKIVLAIICFFSMIYFLLLLIFGGNLNDVAEDDWNDTWIDNCAKGNALKFEKHDFWNGPKYVICNFCNDKETVIKVLETIKNDTTNSESSYYFLWNFKYNDEWKVEYINEDYVNNIARLFDVNILNEKDKKGKFISNIQLFPIMLKYYKKRKIKQKQTSTDSKQVYQVADNKAFDFFLWYDMEKILYDKKRSNPKLKSISFFSINNTFLAEMTLNDSKNGYSLAVTPL